MCGDYNLRREKRYVEVDWPVTAEGSPQAALSPLP